MLRRPRKDSSQRSRLGGPPGLRTAMSDTEVFSLPQGASRLLASPREALGQFAAGCSIWTGCPSMSDSGARLHHHFASIQARDYLGPDPVAQADLDRAARGLAVGDDDAIALAVLIHHRGRRHGRHVLVFLDDDGGVGVQSGEELATRIGNVDLDAECPRFGIERPRDPSDFRPRRSCRSSPAASRGHGRPD